MAAHLQAQPGAQRLVEYVLLVAEAAAHVGLDHPDPAPVHAQGLTHGAPHDVGDLGGGDDFDPVALRLGEADEVLDVAVLHHRRLVPALHLFEARLQYGLFVVALADLGVLEDVVRVCLVQLRRAGLHGLLHVQHEGVFLVLHADQLERLGGGDLVLRHDGGDVVPPEAHALRQHQPIRHVLVGGVGGPGVPRGGKVVFFLQIEAGQHPDHAGYPLRLGGVDGNDPAVGDGGMQHPGDISAPIAHIVRIFGATGHLVKGVHAPYFLSRIHRPFSFHCCRGLRFTL